LLRVVTSRVVENRSERVKTEHYVEIRMAACGYYELTRDSDDVGSYPMPERGNGRAADMAVVASHNGRPRLHPQVIYLSLKTLRGILNRNTQAAASER